MDLAPCSRLATCLISRTVGKKQDLPFEIEEAIVSRQNVIFHIGIWPAQWVLYSATLPKLFCSLMTTSSQKVGICLIWKLAASSHPKHYDFSESFKWPRCPCKGSSLISKIITIITIIIIKNITIINNVNDNHKKYLILSNHQPWK